MEQFLIQIFVLLKFSAPPPPPPFQNPVYATVNRHTINSFFFNFEKHDQNVPPQNVFNFDETNLTDNPKKKRVFVAKGTRRVENVTTIQRRPYR